MRERDNARARARERQRESELVNFRITAKVAGRRGKRAGWGGRNWARSCERGVMRGERPFVVVEAESTVHFRELVHHWSENDSQMDINHLEIAAASERLNVSRCRAHIVEVRTL
jgi:hypothetical protein